MHASLEARGRPELSLPQDRKSIPNALIEVVPHEQDQPGQRTNMKQTSKKRKVAFYIYLIPLVIILCEGISYVVQPLLKGMAVGVDFRTTREIYESQKESIRHLIGRKTNDVFDPDLGWRYRPNFRSDLYSNNSVGMRGTTDYSLIPPDNTVRIAAFGDSFVYGSEVRDRESWPYQLESALPGVEVLNFGVGGYGTDQAYLMYEKFGKQYEPRLVLIGFTSIQIARNVNVFRRFLSPAGMMYVKPRFTLLIDGALRLIPPPIQSETEYRKYYTQPALMTELCKYDYWYAPLIYENPLYDYSATVRIVSQTLTVLNRNLFTRNNITVGGRLNPNSEAFEITTKTLRLFSDQVITDGGLPIFLVFPSGERLGVEGHKRNPVYQALIEYLRREQLDYLDLALAFKDPVTREKHFMPGGHYSPHSNRLVAKAIAAYLIKRGLIQSDNGKRTVGQAGDSVPF